MPCSAQFLSANMLPIARSIDWDPMPRTEEDTTTRQRLEAAAARLFREKGFAGTSIRELAKDVGMESASLYYYFKSKEELLYAISVEALEEVITAVQPLIESEATGRDACRNLISTHMSLMLKDRNKHTAMLLELRALSPRRRRKIIVLRDQYESLVLSILQRAQNHGYLRDDLPAPALKLLLLNLMNWSIFWYRPNGGMTSDQIATWVTTLFLDGASPGHNRTG